MFGNRIKETSTTTGTGNLTLAGAVTGYLSFTAVFGTNTLFGYCIALPASAEWEVGIGYLSGGTTLVRDQVLASSNSNDAVNFSSGTKDVFCTQPAETIVTRGQLAAMLAGAAMVR